MLDQAIQIAETALAGMKGPDEGSYFEHARRVMEQMDTEEEKTVAILHDVVEDGDLSPVSYTHLDVYKRQPLKKRLPTRALRL